MEARVSDFGLATLMEPDKTHVSTLVAGTFGYLAPGMFLLDHQKTRICVWKTINYIMVFCRIF